MKYPWWARILKVYLDQMIEDKLDWIIFNLAREDPVKERWIRDNLTHEEIGIKYGMKVYRGSPEPRKKK
jgi:hypothetical protein